MAIEPEDNELISLEIIHRYVELLDKYFGSVSTHKLVYISHSVVCVCVCAEVVLKYLWCVCGNCVFTYIVESVHFYRSVNWTLYSTTKR